MRLTLDVTLPGSDAVRTGYGSPRSKTGELMRRLALYLSTAILVAISATQGARAQDARSDVVMLPCDGKCATVTRPLKRVSGDSPNIIDQCVPHTHCPEGFVQLLFTVRADGHVDDDISVVLALAPHQYIAAAKRAVRTFLYEPAMVDGQPVAVTGGVTYQFGTEGDTGARPAVKRGYAEATELVKAGKLDEAHAKLTAMLNEPSLNFFERGAILYPLVVIAIQRQQYSEARRYSLLALRLGENNFSEAIYRNMYRYEIASALAMGDIVGAAQAAAEYKAWKHFEPADPIISQVTATQKKLDAMPSYGINASIPDPADGDGYELFLYRRNFTFANIVGKLDRLSIDCREKQAASPVSDKAEWAVPKNWSDCRIFVRGNPGTTFQVVQFSSPPSKAR